MELRMWIKVLFIVQILQDLLECRVNSELCNHDQYEFKNVRCCMKCRAGQRVKKECDAEKPNSTQCEDCQKGAYMSQPNGKESCKFCDPQIKLNRVIVQNCTKTHDRKYGDCVKGFYEDETLNDCMKCKSCPKGFGVVKECLKSANTICASKKCPPSTYSDEESSTQMCRPCIRCQDDERMVKPCTATSNFVCRRSIEKSTPLTVSVTDSTSDILKRPTSVEHSENKGWVMPFFVSAMVLLIILFFGLVVGVSLWCNRQSRRRRQNSVVVEGPASKCLDETESVLLPKEGRLAFVDNRKEVYENGLLIRHVSGDIIEELATYLNPVNLSANWKKVAGLLHFQWSYINNLALCPTTATQTMLESWATKQTSTVYKLYKILKEIGRDDAAEVLEKLLTAPPPSCPKSV